VTWELLAGRFAVYFVVSAVMLAAGVFVYAQNGINTGPASLGATKIEGRAGTR